MLESGLSRSQLCRQQPICRYRSFSSDSVVDVDNELYTQLCTLWGALTRFRLWTCGAAVESLVASRSFPWGVCSLVLVALLPGVALRAPTRVPASSLGGLQRPRDRRTSTRA